MRSVPFLWRTPRRSWLLARESSPLTKGLLSFLSLSFPFPFLSSNPSIFLSFSFFLFSTGTIGKRFTPIGVENSEENRRQYRELLFTAPGIEQYIGGVIFYEETLYQKTSEGKLFTDLISERGILPGIKIDLVSILFSLSILRFSFKPRGVYALSFLQPTSWPSCVLTRISKKKVGGCGVGGIQ